MKERKQLRDYRAPECHLVPVETSYLMQTSFPSQHKPAQPGGTISSAKGVMSWEEEERSYKTGGSAQPWEE